MKSAIHIPIVKLGSLFRKNTFQMLLIKIDQLLDTVYDSLTRLSTVLLSVAPNARPFNELYSLEMVNGIQGNY